MGMKLSMPLKGRGVKRIFSKKKKAVEKIGSSMASSSKSGLPEDLVFEILLLLPVKSLLRFRCVCKSWYTLIENPSFVSKHYYKSSNDTSKIIVEHERDVLLLSNEPLEVSQDLDLTPLRERGYYVDVHRIVGSCYGIICFRDVLKEYTVILWNPSTRQQSKVLPEPHHLPDSRIDDDDFFNIDFGFCYDVKTNDFKVVKFVTLNYLESPNWDDDHAAPQIEVYSLSTDSWKIIDGPIVVPYIYHCWMSVNGVLSNVSNASALDIKFETNEDAVIVSFDTRDEVFLLTPLPGPRTNEICYPGHIAPLNESVAYVQRDYESGDMFIIWVLNEYGSKGSWTKLYTIGEPNCNLLLTAWGFWKNSMLFIQNSNRELVLYDLITQEIKNLIVDEQLIILALISYKESLVSIKGENHLL